MIGDRTMPYLSLYRKYRPRSFAEIVGQRHVTQTLANAVKAGRTAHAYLLCGPRGTGKTSTALVLAMAINCEHGPTPSPCGKCEACARIIAGSALDVFEFDAASHRSVEEISPVLERVALAPAELRSKVYIIDEVHMLSPTAFNAVLKTLEEPPAHVVFVLATTEPHRVLPTILSRCQRFDFHRIGIRDLEDTVRGVAGKEAIEIDGKAVTMLAHAADGSVRDALTLLDQAVAYAEGAVTADVVSEILGGIDFALLAEFADVLSRHDLSAAFALVDRIIAEGKDLRQLVAGLIEHYRNLLLLAVDRRGRDALALPEETVARLVEQAGVLSPEDIIRALDLLSEADREFRFTSQPRLLLELAAVRICRVPETAPAVERPPKRAAKPAPKPSPKAEPMVAEATEPAPAPGPAAEDETPVEPAVPADLAEIQRRWDELLAQLRASKQPGVAAFLREASPIALENDLLTLAFNHRFHYDQMARNDERLTVVCEEVKRMFGHKVNVKCEMASGAEGSEPPPQPKAVQDILAMFPGSEIEE
jgi:DNA polymerase-3 subunit gamma/tau